MTITHLSTNISYDGSRVQPHYGHFNVYHVVLTHLNCVHQSISITNTNITASLILSVC
jgi:hypothetical protein